jgi:YD repeat-containing protein
MVEPPGQQAGVITSSYTYTPAGRLLTATTNGATETYSFDAAGNLTGDGTRTYEYTGNRLTRTKIGQQVITSFSFDAGKRWRVAQAPCGTEAAILTDPGHTTCAYTRGKQEIQRPKSIVGSRCSTGLRTRDLRCLCDPPLVMGQGVSLLLDSRIGGRT